MPFQCDSICLDDKLVSLDDSLKHFWIYEFSSENSKAEPVFKPATTLRSGTPYIIAGDTQMAGRTLVFHALNVPFYKSNSNNLVTTSQNFKFHGNTYSPRMMDCYMLNADGTAFEYTSANKALAAMEPYFTTTLEGEEMPASIVLPDVPVPTVKEVTLDEMAANTIEADTYDVLTLKRTFAAGLNTICLPFGVDDAAALFGEGAKAYEFYGYNVAEGELEFVLTGSMAAGQPYIISLPEASTDDIVLHDILIDEESTEAGVVSKNGNYFRGTYSLIMAPDWEKDIYLLTTEGLLSKLDTAINEEGSTSYVAAFRAFFELPTDAEGLTVRLYDDPTGITSTLKAGDMSNAAIFNLAGQHISRPTKGIYIRGGKKILK